MGPTPGSIALWGGVPSVKNCRITQKGLTSSFTNQLLQHRNLQPILSYLQDINTLVEGGGGVGCGGVCVGGGGGW